MGGASRIDVHCHVPLRVRVVGRPRPADLEKLADRLRTTLGHRLDQAADLLAQGDLPGLAAPAPRPRPLPAGPASADDVRELYDPDRESFDGYQIPSYDGGGEPVAVPVRRRWVPGHDWRVLRAVYFRTSLRRYLDVVTSLTDDEDTGHGEAPFANRVMYEDLEDTERWVTVWLAETEQTTTLGDFLGVLTDRAAELLRLSPSQQLLTSASAVDRYRSQLATIDPTGGVAGLPSLAGRNARRYRGVGRSSVALHGSWVLFTAVAVPTVTIADIVDVGPRTDLSLGIDQAVRLVDVDAARFEREFGVDLGAYGRELADIQVSVGVLPMRVRRDTSPQRLLYVMQHAFGADTLQARPGLTVFYRTVLADEPGAPDRLASVGRDFATTLPPLPPLPGAHQPPPHRPDRIPAGVVVAYASVQLPLDIETRSRVLFAPRARVLAAQLRAFLQRDHGYQWDKDVEGWFRHTFDLPSMVGRPEGGTLFEYVLSDLDASGDLAGLFAAGLTTDSSNVKYYLFELTACTRYVTDPRAAAFTAEMRRHRLFDNFRNGYTPGIPGSTKGSIELDRPGPLLVAGVAGSDVMGDVSSTFITESKQRYLKPEPLARLKLAIITARNSLLGDIAAGGTATTYTPDTFAVEVVKKAAAEARITDDDFYTATVQQSLRILAVEADDHEGLPSYRITVQSASREKGTKAWSPAGEPWQVTAAEFEFNMQMQILGKFGEFTQKVTLVIAGAGVLLVAWEVGAIAVLVELGGGTVAVGISVSVSVAIYIIKAALGYEEWSLEGFVMAAVEGYLAAVGFKIGSLVAGGIGLSLGTATVRATWTGIVLQKLATGVVGGAIGAGLQQFAKDLVDTVAGEGKPFDGWTYVKKMSFGAVMGVVGEFVISPVLKGILTRAGGAWATSAELVTLLRREQITFEEFTYQMTSGLRGLRASMQSLMRDAETAGFMNAVADRVSESLDAWGRGVVARRVLELAGIELTPAASRGVARLVRVSESAGSQDSARQLAKILSESPQEAVTVLEVLSFVSDADAATLVNHTFTDTKSLLGFVAGLSRYDTEAQRGALVLLAKAGVVEAARAPVPAGSGDVLSRQLESAMHLESRLLLTEAQSLRDQAAATLRDAILAETTRRARALRLLEQAVRTEREAAAREALAADLGRGVDPRSIPQRIPDPHIGDDQAALEAELDRAFEQLQGGTGAGRPQAWIRIPATTPKEAASMDALVRRAFRTRSGNPVVFRVEGGAGSEARSWELTRIGADGSVRIATGGKAYNVNVGSVDRVVEYLLANRAGARVKVFEVEADYLDRLRGIATPERGTPADVVSTDPVTRQPTHLTPAGDIKDVTGVPRTVDVSRAADQLQIPAALIPEFEEFVVQDSGRVVEFTPLTATGKTAP